MSPVFSASRFLSLWFSTFMIFDRSSGSCWHDSHIVTGSWQQQSIRELMEARRSQRWVMISKIISDSRRIFHLKWAQRGRLWSVYDYVKSKWLSVTVILNPDALLMLFSFNGSLQLMVKNIIIVDHKILVHTVRDRARHWWLYTRLYFWLLSASWWHLQQHPRRKSPTGNQPSCGGRQLRLGAVQTQPWEEQVGQKLFSCEEGKSLLDACSVSDFQVRNRHEEENQRD